MCARKRLFVKSVPVRGSNDESILILVDAGGPADVAAVNALQDPLPVETGSTGPLVASDDDEESFEAVRQAVLQLGRAVPDGVRMFGKKHQLDPIRHFLGTAGGLGTASGMWGAFPPRRSRSEHR